MDNHEFLKKDHVPQKRFPIEKGVSKSISPEPLFFEKNSYEVYDGKNALYFKNFKSKFQSELEKKDNGNYKKKVFGLLTDLIYNHIMSDFEKSEEIKLPKIMVENKINFCQMLVKNQKMQKFYTNMTEQLSQILKDEIVFNNSQLKLFLNTPQKPSVNLYPSLDKIDSHNQKIELAKIESNHQKYNYRKQLSEKKREFFGIEKNKQRYLSQEQKKEDKLKKLERQYEDQIRNEDDEQKKQEIEKLFKKFKNKIGKSFTDQILAKRKLAFMNQFQLQINDSAEKIEQLIMECDDNNLELRNEVTEIETELEKLENEKANRRTVPGEEIHKIMEKWANEKLYEPDEIFEYGNCLWISLKKYEEQLKNEENGFKILADRQLQKVKNKLNSVQQQTQTYIESMESAFIECKLSYRRELDRMSMHSADIESKLMSLVKPDNYIDAIVKKVDRGYSLKNVTEARVIIAELVGCVKSKHSEIQNYQKEFQIMEASSMIKEKKLYVIEKQQELIQENLNYYKGIVIDLVNKLNLSKNWTDAQKSLINKRKEQKQFTKLSFQDVQLNENIKKALEDHASGYQNHHDNLKKFKERMMEWEILPKDGPVEPKSSLKVPELKRQPTRSITTKNLHNATQRNQKQIQMTGALSPVTKNRNESMLMPAQQRQILAFFRNMGIEDEKPLNQEEYAKAFENAMKFTTAQKSEKEPSPSGLKFEKKDPSVHGQKSENKEMQRVPSPAKSIVSKGTVKVKAKSKPPIQRTGSVDTKKPSNPLSKQKNPVIKTKTYSNLPGTNSMNESPVPVSGTSPVQSPVQSPMESMMSMQQSPPDQKITPHKKRSKTFNNLMQKPGDSSPSRKPSVKFNLEDSPDLELEKLSSIPSLSLVSEEENVTSQKKTDQRNKEISFKLENMIKLPYRSSSNELSLSPIPIQQLRHQQQKLPDQSQKSKLSEPPKSPKQPDIEQIDGFLQYLFYTKFQTQISTMDYLTNKPEFESFFNMKALQVQEWQTLTQKCFGVELPFDDYMQLYQQQFDILTSKLNTLFTKQFFSESEKPDIQMSNMLKPVFDKSGAIQGFVLRNELAPLLFAQNDYEFTQLRRVVKTCIYLNRLIKNGLQNDYQIKQAGESRTSVLQKQETQKKVVEKNQKKEVKNTQKQADITLVDKTEETVKPRQDSFQSFSESTNDEDKPLFSLLRTHMACIDARMNPAKLDDIKQKYQEISSFEELLGKEIKGLKDDCEQPDLTVQEYIVNLFSQIESKVKGLETIELDKIFKSPINESKFMEPTVTPLQQIMKGNVQPYFDFKRVATTDTQSQTEIVTGIDNKPDSKVLNKLNKGSPTTAKALFDYVIAIEIQKTMDLFDDYVAIKEAYISNQEIGYKNALKTDMGSFERQVFKEFDSQKFIEKSFDRIRDGINQQIYQMKAKPLQTVRKSAQTSMAINFPKKIMVQGSRLFDSTKESTLTPTASSNIRFQPDFMRFSHQNFYKNVMHTVTDDSANVLTRESIEEIRPRQYSQLNQISNANLNLDSIPSNILKKAMPSKWKQLNSPIETFVIKKKNIKSLKVSPRQSPLSMTKLSIMPTINNPIRAKPLNLRRSRNRPLAEDLVNDDILVPRLTTSGITSYMERLEFQK